MSTVKQFYMQCLTSLSCTGEEWEKARKLQDKMKSNLENTRERLDELGMLLNDIIYNKI